VDKTFKQAGNKYDALWVPGGDPPMLSKLINANGAYLNFLRDQAKNAHLLGVRRRDASRWRGPARWL
jgi:putative intracellular protease/amidase